ncbi:hypothetical protein Tco_0486935 [Tanacetum coccineum]
MTEVIVLHLLFIPGSTRCTEFETVLLVAGMIARCDYVYFMDFDTGLPVYSERHDAIWVVVDRLTKSAHFLPIRYRTMRSKSLRLDFWKDVQISLGKPVLSQSGISSSNRWSVREDIQIWKVMLRACALGMGQVRMLIELTYEKVAVAKEKLKEA